MMNGLIYWGASEKLRITNYELRMIYYQLTMAITNQLHFVIFNFESTPKSSSYWILSGAEGYNRLF